MNKEDILRVLQEHQVELEAAGIAHLRLFGSMARDEATNKSDVDLMVELDNSRPTTLLRLGRLQSELADLLGASVDLTFRDAMRPVVSERAMSEAILAF